MAVGIKGVNPGDILQAMETQLVTSGALDVANPIYWLMDGNDPPANATGKRDVLFCVTNQLVPNQPHIGGGRIGLRFQLLIEVRLRTILLLDKTGTDKDRLIDHWNQEVSIISALDRFFPTDTGDNTGNALTIEGLMLDLTVPPRPAKDLVKWGGSCGYYRCTYLAAISNTPLG